MVHNRLGYVSCSNAKEGFQNPKMRLRLQDFIKKSLAEQPEKTPRPTALVVWNGPLPLATLDEDEDGNAVATLLFHHKQHAWELETSPALGQWLVDVLPLLQIGEQPVMTFAELQRDFEENAEGGFTAFLATEEWAALREEGLWVL